MTYTKDNDQKLQIRLSDVLLFFAKSRSVDASKYIRGLILADIEKRGLSLENVRTTMEYFNAKK